MTPGGANRLLARRLAGIPPADLARGRHRPFATFHGKESVPRRPGGFSALRRLGPDIAGGSHERSHRAPADRAPSSPGRAGLPCVPSRRPRTRPCGAASSEGAEVPVGRRFAGIADPE